MAASALPSFQPDWPAQVSSSGPWRTQLAAYNAWANELFASAEIDALLSSRSHFFDQLLSRLWQAFGLDQADIALVAIGGYGRGILHPASDIDLLVLFNTPLTAKQERSVSDFITFLWDLRIDIGHSVRSVADCMIQAAADITIATSLIENRYITGEKKLAQALNLALTTEFPWQSRDFYQAKCDEQHQRHKKYHSSSYNLEPNIKLSPGGLRDIQTIHWIAKQHFKTRRDESLVEYNYITAEEFVELREYQSFLWRIRYALHDVAGKNENRLLFDYQPEVAQRLGFGGTDKRAVERMMKSYFQVVLKVGELNQMLLQFFEQAILGPVDIHEPEPLSDDFALNQQLIMVRNDQAFAQPEQIMRFFVFIAKDKRIKGIHSHTIRLLRNARVNLTAPLSENTECRTLFRELLVHPTGFGRAFALMHRHGIMACYLKAWAHIVGQMQFDLFHAYTVDEHTFRLIRNLYRFTLPAHSEEFPLASDIVQQLERPELLFLAGIFHDIAKGRGGDHSELGAIDAYHFCIQHDYSEADAELVAWLVRQHLLMSLTAQKRDIYDPDVIQAFAREVRTKQRLQLLYCLTVADIRATNSNLWNNWKASLLEELYRATEDTFQNHGESAITLRQRIQENKQLALALLLSAGFDALEVQQLWARFTADYFSRHTPEQISWHSQHLIHVKERQLPLILIGDENNQGTTEIFIYHLEENHLFANVAAVLDAQHLSIHDAKILNTRDGYVMDTFIVLERDSSPLYDQRRIEEVRQHLHDVLRKRRSPPRQQRGLSRRMKNFKVATQLTFLPQKNERKTAFELVTLDRPGLIARVTRVFIEQQLNLLAAKITTVGEQAEDLFIVCNAQQKALTDVECEALRDAIVKELDH